MTLSMYALSVPLFVRSLRNLRGILDKALANANERGIKPEVLGQARLAPDMNPLTFQVQNATDRAKLCVARLSGQTAPAWEDTEKTIEELQARVDKAIAYLEGFKPEDIDGSETRQITLKTRQGESVVTGEDHLLHNVLPQFYFHVTAAYAILRHNGVPIGKGDYIGR